ncbi:NADH-quinone oxidoreductase subunit C [Patulibacter defluvii]|uniref:NADH-quinone oxidoreductase subunit C n=1 Tax=Patulibacter defluvii TaxID=3095358 RepID=UPI002A754D40|nr:NADH-quinone oxidoreductase subunit C [Patulibacter sp. DM4]
MPDGAALERLAQLVGTDAVLATVTARGRAEIEVRPAAIGAALERLRSEGYTMLMSLHGVDYHPEEPRLGVVYELLSMQLQDRVTVKVRVPIGDPHVPSVVSDWPTADYQEREAFDMFGVVFDGHPDLRRILMPEDYLGHPQRRDFPIGGEPVIFTENERRNPGWWK